MACGDVSNAVIRVPGPGGREETVTVGACSFSGENLIHALANELGNRSRAPPTPSDARIGQVRAGLVFGSWDVMWSLKGVQDNTLRLLRDAVAEALVHDP